VAGAFGLAAVGFGVTFAIFAKAKLDQSNKPGECVNDICTSQGEDDRNSALGLAKASTWSVVTGLLLIGGGVALYVTAPSGGQPRVGISAGPGSLVVRGTL
jgi:hypothetical protein